jgi:predicted TIM-barrel fold metal-dependent hydrolase
MYDQRIDHSFLNPSLMTFINTVHNRSFADQIVTAFNEWVVDTYGDFERAAILMVISPHEPTRAAEEIDRWADEDSIVGVQFCPPGMVPPAGDKKYDPVYETAQNHGLPLAFHPTAGAGYRSFPMQSYWSQTYAESHSIMHPFTHMWNLNSLVCNGVPERFPDLKFVFQEAGIGWIPYMIWRLDDHYLQLSHDFPVLEKMPSEYIREQFYFSTQPLGHTVKNGHHIAQIIDMVGTDSIMYSADLTHADFDPPEELFDRIKGHFDSEAVNDIMGGNAVDVFELDV